MEAVQSVSPPLTGQTTYLILDQLIQSSLLFISFIKMISCNKAVSGSFDHRVMICRWVYKIAKYNLESKLELHENNTELFLCNLD